MSQFDATFYLEINVGLSGLYFIVWWFLPYNLKTFWWMNNILWNNESVLAPVFLPHVQWFWPIEFLHSKTFYVYWQSTIQASYTVLRQLLSWEAFVFISPQTAFVGGILFSRPSICPSATFWFFLDIFHRQWWNFINPCKHIDILKIKFFIKNKG